MDKALRAQWKLRNKSLQEFWRLWRRDYLLELRSFHEVKNPDVTHDLNLGDCSS